MGTYSPTVDGDVIEKWDKEFVTNMLKIFKQQTENKIQTIKINKLFNFVTIIYFYLTIELHQKLFV